MNFLIMVPPLLAQSHRLDGMRSGFQPSEGGGSGLLLSLLGILALLALLWFLAKYVAHIPRIREYLAPRRLLRDLCVAHDLSWSEQRLLYQLAKYHRLNPLPRIFLEPDYWNAQSWEKKHPARAIRVRELGAKLFPELLKSTQAGDSQGEDSVAA